MKTTLLKIKSIVWFLCTLFLFVGCSVYKSTPATFEEAAKKRHPVKIHTINNESIKYNRIDYKDGVYYGINRREGQDVLIPLKQNEINSVQLKNKTASTVGNVAIGMTVAGLILRFTGAGWNY